MGAEAHRIVKKKEKKENTMKHQFKSVIGQKSAVDRLSFAIEARNHGRILPHFMFTSAFGSGKTMLMREFAKNILVDGKAPKYIEVNCGTIKSANQFFEKVWMPHMFDRTAVLALDEIHSIPKDLVTIFLTMFNTEKSHIRRIQLADSEVEIDFSRQIVMGATTEPDHIFRPLMSRFERLSLAPYSKEELAKVIEINLPDIEFEDNVLMDIVETIKGTPRSAIHISRKIGDYCCIKGRKLFDSSDFFNLMGMADIRMGGLDDTEISILRLLKERGPMSLTELSATLDISSTAIRRDHEHHPLKKGFIRIDGKRELTNLGRKMLENFKTKE